MTEANQETPPADNAQNTAQNPDNAQEAAPAPSPAPAGGEGGAYRPENMPDHMLGKDDKETIDKLLNGYIGFRKAAGEKGVPESADGYTLDALPEEIKGKFLRPGEDGKDPLLEKLKPVLYKNNIPAQAFAELAQEFYGAVAEMAGGADKNPDGTPVADFEYKDHGGAEKAAPLVEGAEVWIKGLAQSKKISEKTAAELQMMAGYGEGLSALMELRAAMGEKPIPRKLGGDGAPEITKAMLDSRFADPRYWSDPAFQEETVKLNNAFWNAA